MEDNLNSDKLCFQCHTKVSLDATACHNCGALVERDDVVTASGTFTFVNCKSCGVPITKENTHCPICKKRRMNIVVLGLCLTLSLLALLVIIL